MRKLIIIFILFDFIGNAQNWNVFNIGYRYNYKFDNSQLISNVLFVESSSVVANDTIYNMNNIGVVTGNTLTINRPQFLMKKIIKKANGDVQLQDTTNITIIPTCSLSQSWLFDTNYNLTATCVSTATQAIFNVVDSIKIIKVNNADSVVLSKQFGIIQFPKLYGQNKYYRLVGIEKANRYGKLPLFGQKVPNAWDFYDFPVGREWCVQETYHLASCAQNDHCSKKYMTVLSKTVTNTGYIYNVDVDLIASNLSYTWCTGGSGPHYFSNIDVYFDNLDTTILIENSMYPGMVVGSPFWDHIVRFGSLNNGGFTKIIGDVSNSSYSGLVPQITNVPFAYDQTSPSTYSANFSGDKITGALFSVNKGKIFEIFTHTSDYEIVLSQSCDIYMSINNSQEEMRFDYIYPNPANSQLQLPIDHGCVKLYDAFGKLIKEEILENKSTLDISQLLSGVYLIEIQTDSFKSSQKLIIQH